MTGLRIVHLAILALITTQLFAHPVHAQPPASPVWGRVQTDPGPGEAAAWTAPDGRTVAQLIADHVLPDPAATPGVLNPDVTPDTLKATVCVANWTATVRPPTSFTDRLRNADTPPGSKPLDGELDHLVSIEDGGAPADAKNLWWMVYADLYGARVKDVLETKVKRLLCAGRITLDQARAALSPNWLIGYQQYVGPLPAPRP